MDRKLDFAARWRRTLGDELWLDPPAVRQLWAKEQQQEEKPSPHGARLVRQCAAVEP
jgi:hypothetical protein